jgi:hypothetical protein
MSRFLMRYLETISEGDKDRWTWDAVGGKIGAIEVVGIFGPMRVVGRESTMDNDGETKVIAAAAVVRQ